MQLARYFRGSLRTRTWLDRALVLFVLALLSLQLLSAGRHKDDHVGYSDNCASCFFAHQVPHGLPDVDPVLAPARAATSYRVERFVIHQAPSLFSFLIPSAHAPPRG
jgi:hypothetical protein